MLFGVTIVAYCENHTKFIKINIEFLTLHTAHGTDSYHCASRSYEEKPPLAPRHKWNKSSGTGVNKVWTETIY
jgi:hypothetical protein